MRNIKGRQSSALVEGILWNYLATALMAASGFVCNIIISFFYNVEAVGLFNRVYSYYLVISQISVFGVHMSIGHSIPKLPSKDEKEDSFWAAIILTVGIASGVSIVLWGFLWMFKEYIIISTQRAVSDIILALIFFSINKVILAYLNANSRMKEYAILQAVRYLSIGGCVLLFSIVRIKSEHLVLCYLISELTVLLFGVFFLRKMDVMKFRYSKEYIKEHFLYGKKIFLSNLVLDLNTKIDIISLGIILQNDYFIGIYSFAAMFIEGFYQILVVIRRNINPKITRHYYNQADETSDLRKAKTYVDITSSVVLVGIVVGYYVICNLFGKQEYVEGIWVILIIGVSIFLTRRYILFGNILSQIGKPEYETKVNIGTVLVNISANFALIPFCGMLGAAFGTAVSYIAFAVLINYFRKKKQLGINRIFVS